MIIPKELERIDEQQYKLTQELKTMEQLLSIVGKEMLAGISEQHHSGNRAPNSRLHGEPEVS